MIYSDNMESEIDYDQLTEDLVSIWKKGLYEADLLGFPSNSLCDYLKQKLEQSNRINIDNVIRIMKTANREIYVMLFGVPATKEQFKFHDDRLGLVDKHLDESKEKISETINKYVKSESLFFVTHAFWCD